MKYEKKWRPQEQQEIWIFYKCCYSALKFKVLGMCDILVLNCGSVINFVFPWPTQIYPDLEIKEQQQQQQNSRYSYIYAVKTSQTSWV